MIARIWRAAVVLVTITGLFIDDNGIVYFTIQTNLIVAVYFAALVWRGSAFAPRWRGAVTTWIIATGLTYHFLLQGGASPFPGLAGADGAALLGNWSQFLLHYATPTMVTIDWLVFGPRRTTRWPDGFIWTAYPLVYGLFVIGRGVLLPDVATRYPYPFLDPTGQGWGGVVTTVVLILLAIGAIALVVIGLDWLPRPGNRSVQRSPR
jgi:hypothetical protein